MSEGGNGRGSGPNDVAARLSVTTHWRGEFLLVELAGELDVASAVIFREALPPPGQGARLLLDVRRLRFIDAGGLREFVRLVHEGRSVVIEGASHLLRKILEVTGTAPLFDLDPPHP